MTKMQERLAALAAGGELSPRERKRFERDSAADERVAQLTQELARQRQASLALHREGIPAGDPNRTLRALREQIESSKVGTGARPGWLLPATGLAMVALIALLARGWVLGLDDPALAPPTVVRVYPLPPEALAQAGRKLVNRAPTGVATVARERRIHPAGGVPVAATLQSVMNHVDEVLSQKDGSYRLRLRTKNPNVVIYLVQGGSEGLGGER